MAITINGRPTKLLLDTGSTRSLLTSEATRRLGMTVERLLDDSDVLVGFAIEGLGGRRHVDRAWPRTVKLGRAVLLGVPFSVVWSRNTGWDPSADGMLGMDILSRYDMDLDVGRSRLALYEPGAMCPPPISAGASAIRLTQDLASVGPRVVARIDGQAFEALIDTGAQRSSIVAQAAARLVAHGMRGERFTVYGVGTGRTSAVLQEFGALTVGGIVLPQRQLAVIGGPGLGGLDMVIGEDVLSHTRVWLSGSRRSLILAESQPGETD